MVAGETSAKLYDFTGLKELSPSQAQATNELEKKELLERAEKSQAKAAGRYRLLEHQPMATLNNGHKIPLVGLGTWKSARGEVKAAVETAIKAGYRHIDCAAVYQNEHEVGEALKNIAEEGIVARSNLFITSKLWNNMHAAGQVEKACLSTLKDLGLDYMDLYLIHFPVSDDKPPVPYKETWQAMEQLVDKGLVHSIGVSNMSIKKLKEVLSYARIKPAVNQVEVHPYFRNDSLIEFCKSEGIHVTAYSPLGSPDSAYMFKRKYTPSLLKDETVTKLAEKYHKDAGQILIKWSLQHGTSVLPKSTKAERICSNIDVFDWQLEPADYDALCKLNVVMRMVDGTQVLPKDGSMTLVDLWDDPEEETRQEQLLRSMYRLDLDMPTATLNNGHKMPLIGLGTWLSKQGEAKAAVIKALQAGYRHIDTAEAYQNHDQVGEGLAEVFSEGVVKREDVHVTTKLWNTDHKCEDVEKAARKALKELQLEYLDLYLMHWPIIDDAPIHETWKAMEKLVDLGLVRAIGVSNFSIKKLKDLLSYARIRPAVNQVEVHPYFRNDALIDFCKSEGIQVTAYSPLGSPGSGEITKVPKDAPKLMEDPVVKEIAQKLGKNPGQVLIRWALQHGTSVLPKSTNPERIVANLDVLKWELPIEDYQRLSQLSTQMRMVPGSNFINPQGPYKSPSELWDE